MPRCSLKVPHDPGIYTMSASQNMPASVLTQSFGPEGSPLGQLLTPPQLSFTFSHLPSVNTTRPWPFCEIRWFFLLFHDLPQPCPSSSKPDYFMLTTPLPRNTPTVPTSRPSMAWCQPPCQALLLPISFLCFMLESTMSATPVNKAW